MKKAEVVKTYAKALRKDKLKSYLLAACAGIVSGLMYHVGVHAGANATCQKLAEVMPDDAYDSEEADENN